MEPKLSVIVPVYNVEKYLRQCLDSVVNQTLKEIEIICINDGSKDGSLEILREYEEKDPRVKVISKHNSGYGATMNIGLETAKGEYIGIVESDDFAELDMFETLYGNAKKHGLDISRSDFFYYENERGENKESNFSFVPHNEVYSPVERQKPFYQAPAIWASIYRRKWLNENGIRFLETPGASFQDTSFAFKAYLTAKRFMMIEKPLLHYRINENSSVSSDGKVFCVCDEYAEIKRFAKESGLYEKVKYLIPCIQLGCYKWNYNRLSRSKRRKFMRRWHREMLGYVFRRELKKEMYEKRDYIKLLTVALAPFLFNFRKHF